MSRLKKSGALFVLFTPLILLASCKVSTTSSTVPINNMKESTNTVVSVLQSNQAQDVDLSIFIDASFPGGNDAFNTFMLTPRMIQSDSLKVRGIAKQDLMVICNIDTMGKAIDIRMHDKPTGRSSFPYNEEMATKALEVVKSMINWNPALLHEKKTLQKDVFIRIRVMVE